MTSALLMGLAVPRNWRELAATAFLATDHHGISDPAAFVAYQPPVPVGGHVVPLLVAMPEDDRGDLPIIPVDDLSLVNVTETDVAFDTAGHVRGVRGPGYRVGDETPGASMDVVAWLLPVVPGEA